MLHVAKGFTRGLKVSLAAAALVMGVGLGSTGWAAPVVGGVTIGASAPSGTAYLDCPLGCSGWVGNPFEAATSGFNSTTKADVYQLDPPPNEANALAELRLITGNPGLTAADTVYNDNPGNSIDVGAGSYIKLKFGNFGNPGPGYANVGAFFFFDQAQTITYNSNNQEGGGLSHTWYVPIPLPAAAWLMLAGIGTSA